MAYSCYLTAAQPWAYNLTLRSSVFSFVPLTTWSEWIPLKTVVVLSAWYTGSTKNRRLYFVTAKPYHSPLSSWSTIFHSKSWTTLEKKWHYNTLSGTCRAYQSICHSVGPLWSFLNHRTEYWWTIFVTLKKSYTCSTHSEHHVSEGMHTCTPGLQDS